MNHTIKLIVATGAAAVVGCAAEKSTPAPTQCTPAPGTICTVVGNGDPAFYGDNKSALEAAIYQPVDILSHKDGAMYVVDWSNHKIRQIDKAGIITTVGGIDGLGDGPDGPALKHHFNHPTHLTFDSVDNIVISAWHNSKMKLLDLKAGTIKDFCGTGKRAYAGDGGPAVKADLDLPSSAAYDKAGNLLFTDQANHLIRRIKQDGTIESVAGQCIVEQAMTPEGKDWGATKCAEGEVPKKCSDFNGPDGKPIASQKRFCGNVTDPAMVNPICQALCTAGFKGDGGPATEARFAQPTSQSADPGGRMVLDANDNILVADTLNHRIRRIDAKTNIVTTVAGKGQFGVTGGSYSGDGGKATDADLNYPTDLEVAKDGTLFIADTYNHCIRKVGTDGVITTFAGQCGKKGDEGDGGKPTDARINRPYGIALTKAGDLLIADTNNHRIRMIKGAAAP